MPVITIRQLLFFRGVFFTERSVKITKSVVLTHHSVSETVRQKKRGYFSRDERLVMTGTIDLFFRFQFLFFGAYGACAEKNENKKHKISGVFRFSFFVFCFLFFVFCFSFFVFRFLFFVFCFSFFVFLFSFFVFRFLFFVFRFSFFVFCFLFSVFCFPFFVFCFLFVGFIFFFIFYEVYRVYPRSGTTYRGREENSDNRGRERCLRCSIRHKTTVDN